MVTLPDTDTTSALPSAARPQRPGRGLDRRVLAPLLGAGVLVLLAFLTTGGVLTGPPTQVPNSWVNAVLIVLGGVGLAGLAITRRQGGGSLSVLLFGALALLSGLSIAWSVAPDQSWEEAGRIVAYLAVFVIGVVLARRSGADRSGAVVLAITLAASGLCLWALAVKALDLNLYSQPLYGPLLSPFGYWNATGVLGACAIPGLLWIASARRGDRLLGHPACRGLAVAGIAMALTVVALTYSRSAIFAAALGVLIPLCFLASRRRAVLMLALGLLGAIPACLYGLSSHDITADAAGSIYNGSTTLAAHRGGAELTLGAILLGVIIVLTALATALSSWLDHHPQPAHRLRAVDRGLLSLLCAAPVFVVIWLLVNSRGPGGEISHIWTSLTSVSGTAVGGGVNRLGSVANSRSVYWRQAIAVGDHHLLAGAGLGAFLPAYLHYVQAGLSPRGFTVSHAHGYLVETYATLGLLGLSTTLAVFFAWIRDAARSLRRATATASTSSAMATMTAPATEFDARWALIGVVIAFGTSSALDWTWFFPGLAIPALLAAGWISGVAGPRRSAAASSEAAGPARPAATPPRPITTRPGVILAITLLALVSFGAAWASLGPMRADQSDNAADNAIEAGLGTTALSDARAATREDPLSATALDALASVYGDLGHHGAQEYQALVKATQIQPQNPQPYLALGNALLCSRRFAAATNAYATAGGLDLNPSLSQIALLQDARDRQRPEDNPC